ncbi:MAG: hypothetical protein ACM31P_02995 [Actinomycetota bacterium]
MKTLTIKDLPRTEALDAKAMAAVQGGMMKGMPSYYWMSAFDGSKNDKSLDVTQKIGQNQETFNFNGNNVAFADGISSKVKPTQTATNTVFA